MLNLFPLCILALNGPNLDLPDVRAVVMGGSTVASVNAALLRLDQLAEELSRDDFDGVEQTLDKLGRKRS